MNSNLTSQPIRRNYCSHCGSDALTEEIPPLDDRPRIVCANCNAIHYDNPKMVVGCIPEWEDKILLCRRDIEPCRGMWTLPAGYLENGESLADGAKRETHEEAGATVEIIQPYAIFDIPHINQVYLLFRARMLNKAFGPTPESAEVTLMTEKEIPWEEMAFRAVIQTLRRYFDQRAKGHFSLQTGTIPPVEKSF